MNGAALLLGVSPKRLRKEYIMVDLPMLLYQKTQQIAEDRLANLHIAMAPNMTEESFRKLVENLSWSLEDSQQSPDEFDRRALEALRQRIGRRKS